MLFLRSLRTHAVTWPERMAAAAGLFSEAHPGPPLSQDVTTALRHRMDGQRWPALPQALGRESNFSS